MSRRFPWRQFMAAGIGTLKLPPAAFWASTPREIAAALSLPVADGPSRAGLEDLLQLFPDET